MSCLNHLSSTFQSKYPPSQTMFICTTWTLTHKVWNHLCDVMLDILMLVWASLTALHIYYWTCYTLLTAHSNELTHWRPCLQPSCLLLLGLTHFYHHHHNRHLQLHLNHLTSAVLHLWETVDSQSSDCLCDSSAPERLGGCHENWICCTPWICKRRCSVSQEISQTPLLRVNIITVWFYLSKNPFLHSEWLQTQYQ